MSCIYLPNISPLSLIEKIGYNVNILDLAISEGFGKTVLLVKELKTLFYYIFQHLLVSHTPLTMH